MKISRDVQWPQSRTPARNSRHPIPGSSRGPQMATAARRCCRGLVSRATDANFQGPGPCHWLFGAADIVLARNRFAASQSYRGLSPIYHTPAVTSRRLSNHIMVRPILHPAPMQCGNAIDNNSRLPLSLPSSVPLQPAYRMPVHYALTASSSPAADVQAC